MDDFDRHLIEVYQRVLRGLTDDEIRARLARRRTPFLQRPPRPWCLCIRAADTRITPDSAILIPDDATRDPRNPQPHTVVVDKRLLETLCAPVHLQPLTRWTDLAQQLGTTKHTLRYAMKVGHLRLAHHKGLGGSRGRPVPCVLNSDTLDPCSSKLRRPADGLWGARWAHAAQHLPDDLRHALQRTPAFRPGRHHLEFRGYLWTCPACQKPARNLYYPLPHLTIPKYLGDPAAATPEDAQPDPPATFACKRCHHVRYVNRTDRNAWNHLISHLTGGLLYGHEVPKPDWFQRNSTKPHRPQRHPRPSKRQQVLTHLLQGLTYQQIATTLHIARPTVNGHATALYRQHDVHSREELVEKLRRIWDQPQPT